MKGLFALVELNSEVDDEEDDEDDGAPAEAVADEPEPLDDGASLPLLPLLEPVLSAVKFWTHCKLLRSNT